MRTANRMSRLQRLQWVCAALSAGVLLFAGLAQAQQYFTLRSHVPPAVANGQAAWLDELRSTQRLSLAISLPLRHETEPDDLLQRLDDPESPLRSGSLGFCTTLMSAVLCWKGRPSLRSAGLRASPAPQRLTKSTVTEMERSSRNGRRNLDLRSISRHAVPRQE
jgi:hypothetical protein